MIFCDTRFLTRLERGVEMGLFSREERAAIIAALAVLRASNAGTPFRAAYDTGWAEALGIVYEGQPAADFAKWSPDGLVRMITDMTDSGAGGTEEAPHAQ
jgi:hypothetical protein